MRNREGEKGGMPASSTKKGVSDSVEGCSGSFPRRGYIRGQS